MPVRASDYTLAGTSMVERSSEAVATGERIVQACSGLRLLSKTSLRALFVTLLAIAGNAVADTPAFDRPGIAFSTSTIPRGGVAVELGVPDFVHSSDAFGTSTLYRLDTNIRAGLGANTDIELATPVFNYQDTKDGGTSNSAHGLGDSSLSLKAVLPSGSDKFSWAGLAGVTLATGTRPFTEAQPLYSLATSMSLFLDHTYSAGFYIDLNYFDSRTGYTLSPNLNATLNDSLSAYVQVGYTHIPQIPDTTIAGTGIAWMVAPTVQLDMYVDLGLTHDSPDVQGGVGISFYIK